MPTGPRGEKRPADVIGNAGKVALAIRWAGDRGIEGAFGPGAQWARRRAYTETDG